MSMMLNSARLALLKWICAFVLVVVTAAHAHAQTVDVIRGRVMGPENQPVEGVNVTVTTLSGAVSRSARTDRNGRFMVTFPGGDGDYFVSFQALGYAPRRYEIKRVADEDILVADARLTRAAAQLGEVRVVAPRDRPNRNDANQDVSGTERTVNPSALAANQVGDLAAMAASVPGVLFVPGQDGDPSGFSVFGLSSDQNSTTLNGQEFSGSDLPRDAAISASLVTSPYDVSRGGFSGGNFNIRTRSGTNFILRTNSLNVDSPHLQWTDAAAAALGQQYSNLSLGGMMSGPIRYNQAFYSLAYQLGRRANDLQTLLNTSPVGLQTTGIAPDSAERLLSILGTLGIPTTVGGLPSDRLTDQGSLIGGFDLAPPSSRAGSAYNLTVNGSWNRLNPVTGQVTEIPAHSGDRLNFNGGLQARHSTYFGFGALSETALSVSGTRSHSNPFLSMPSGTVRINSVFDDGTSAVKTVTFGGSPSLNSTNATVNVAFNNQLSWFSENNKHRIKLSTEVRRDAYSIDQQVNTLGSFTFNSLADLDAGRAGAFARQLQPRQRQGDEVVGGIALGDSYRPVSNLQLQYGVRVDGNLFSKTPTRNSKVDELFGVRNDVVPNGVYVSPRVGFSWTYGQASQIGGFEGAFRGPRAIVRGGIGVFQATPGTQLTGAAIDNTGLAGGLQQVNCTGIAVPSPEWAQYLANQSSIPAECADGTLGTVFASSVPNVTLFDDGYRAPRSIRSNLQWSGPILANRFSAQLEGTLSVNQQQQGFVDLNFQPTERFALGSEGGRAVYVQPTSIDPATGLVAARDARVTQDFNRVTEQRSDLRSLSRQVRVSLSPATFNSTRSWSVSYVYSNVRDRNRGFSSNTVGNPYGFEWARSSFDSRHQIQYSLFYNLFDLIRVNWNGNIRSGTPFTPLISGDVNGDGYANDRAFVFDPASSGDPLLAQAMQALLDGASGNVKRCLSDQLGHLAARNSCNGPWTQSANLSLSFNPLKVRMPQRATLSFSVSNPLGAADLMLHGSDNLRGWGQSPIPDQTLLFVRGFDRTSNTFRYDVNQRFGATNPQFSAFRTPVTITALLRFDVGPTRERQALTQQLNLGRRTDGNKLPENIIKAIYGTGGLINPLATMLRQSDTLKLTVQQADSLATLNRWYLIRTDSIWAPIAKYLAALPDSYDAGDAYDRYVHGRRATVDLLRTLAPAVRGLLSEEQRRRLPALVASYLDPRYLVAIRSGTAGAGGAGLFPGGGGGPLAIPGERGGGQAITIIR
ncbi:MAG: carboxypeptidase regulatory-like domain-containing protein [Gemmatimonadaceae bacterium]